MHNLIGSGTIGCVNTLQLVRKNKGLLKAFKKYQERYLNVGKKPKIEGLLPEDLYHTMRLEGEKITRKQAYALFKQFTHATYPPSFW